MVKREDAIGTSQGGVRDTHTDAVQQRLDIEPDEAGEFHEGRYTPEMGTIIVNDYVPPSRES